MSFIKRFLRLRKQDDRIKIMLVLGIIAIVLLVSVIKDTVTMYNYVNSPVEYELMGNLSSNLRINEISQLENVETLSLQSDVSATVRYKMNETSISYMSISAEYAAYVYGVESSGNMTTYYANDIAYERLLKDLQVDRYYDAELYEGDEIILEYKAEGERYISGKVVLVEELSYDKPFVFTIEDSATLKNRATKLRVYVSKQDMEQMIIKELGDRGYSLWDMENVMKFQHKLDTLLLEIKYQVIICIMCIIWIFTLHRYKKI